MCACRWGPVPPAPRRYTLTHNDLTGELQLSVGGAYNMAQISSWYNRLIRCAFGLYSTGAGTALCSKCIQRGIIERGRRWYVTRNRRYCVRKQITKADVMQLFWSEAQGWQNGSFHTAAACMDALLVERQYFITARVDSAGSMARTLTTVFAGMRC